MTYIYAFPQVKFISGEIYVTADADRALTQDAIQTALMRHANGDWGDVCPEDSEANETALATGGRLFSVYHDGDGVKFWIITEADRNSTTVFLPNDY